MTTGRPIGVDAEAAVPWPHPLDAGHERPDALSIVVGRALGTVVVTVHGELDLTGSELLGELLGDLIDGQGNRTVAVDLAGADVAPGVFAVFVAAARRARSHGARFVLAGPSAALDEALQAFGQGDLVEIQRRGQGRVRA